MCTLGPDIAVSMRGESALPSGALNQIGLGWVWNCTYGASNETTFAASSLVSVSQSRELKLVHLVAYLGCSPWRAMCRVSRSRLKAFLFQPVAQKIWALGCVRLQGRRCREA